MSTAIRVPDSGPSRSTRSAMARLLDEVGGPFRDRDDGGVAVARRYRRHDARIHDADAGQTADPQLRVDNRQVVDAHPAGTGLVVVTVGAVPHEPLDVGPRAHVRPGHQLALEVRLERGGREDVPGQLESLY